MNDVNIVEVLCKAKQLFITHPEYIGMCHCIGLALEGKDCGSVDMHLEDIPTYIPEFNRKFLNAPKDRNGKAFWWDSMGEAARKARLQAFDKLIKYYCNAEIC